MRPDDFSHAVAEWAAGDHLCCLYDSEEEHRALLTPFLRIGLERGEQVVYIVDAHTAEAVMGYLRDDGLEVESYLSSGQFVILTAEEAYARGGHFDPDEMIAFLRAKTERALEEGYRALRVSGEMTWVLKGLPGSERLIEYESKLNAFFPGSQCLGLCQYDRRRFSSSLLLDVLATHPIVVVGTQIYDNFYYVPPADLLKEDLASRTLGHWLETLASRRRADARLRRQTGFVQLLQDVAVAANEAESVGGALQFALDRVCQETGWPLGHACAASQDGSNEIEPRALWHVADGERFRAFLQVTDRTRFTTGVGFPGQVFATGKPRWLVDVTQEPGFVRAKEAAAAGIKAAFAFPVLVGKEVVDVLEFFSTDAAEPDEGLLHVMAHIGTQLGRVVERKRSEEELRRSEAQLADAQQLAHIGSWEWDIPGNRLSWSDEMYRIYGRSPEHVAVTYRTFLEWLHPNDRESVVSTIQRAYEDHQPFSFEHRVVRPDGTVRTLMGQGKVVLDSAGQPVRMVGTGQDITERVRAEQALRENRAMLEALFESGPDAVVLVNKEGRIVRINRQSEALFGYQRDELVGKPVEVLMPARFRGRHMIHRSRYHDEPGTRPMGAGMDLFGRRKDGSEFPIDVVLSHLETVEGPLVISVVRDVTERVRGEEEIRRSKEFAERLINSSLDGIFAFDREWRLTVWNPGMERISGLTRSQALDRDAFDVFPSFKEIGEDRYFQEALAGRTAIARDRAYSVPETGRQGYFEGYYSPIRDETGNVVGGLAIVRDISDRKQAQKAWEESEQRFRTVFEQGAIGISLVNVEGRVIDSNPALQQMLGYTAEELRGMLYSDFTHPSDVKVSSQLYQGLMAGRHDSHRLEKRYLRKDGRTIWGHLTASVIRNSNGEAQFVIGMIKDITERKQMEAELAEVQHRLIESRETERIYLAQELHDGPLQVLYSVSYHLRDLGDVLPDEVSMGRMVAAQALLQQVIRMLRTITGELRPPALAPFGLEKAIRSHAEGFRDAHPELEVQLDLMPDEQRLPEQTRLALFRIYQQALSNVVRHAQASHVSIRFRLDSDAIILEVEDDGRGFEVPERWIDLAREGHLGLVGTAERAEAIGGSLEIRSAPAEGTLIRVTLPCAGVSSTTAVQTVEGMPLVEGGG
jgi:PAS domain S-box-containing protein